MIKCMSAYYQGSRSSDDLLMWLLLTMLLMPLAGMVSGIATFYIGALLSFYLMVGQELAGYRSWSPDLFQLVLTGLGPVAAFLMARSMGDVTNDPSTPLERTVFMVTYCLGYSLAAVAEITLISEHLSVSFPDQLQFTLLTAGTLATLYIGRRTVPT